MATPSLAMIPSAIADSKVYSVLPNNGDGDFTFNRDSSATRIGQNGLIQTVGYFGSELVTNGDFATDTDWTKETGWTISGGTANFSGGTGNKAIYQAAGITNGKTYKIQYQVSSISAGQVAVRLGGMAGVDEITATTIGNYTGYITATGSANGNIHIEDNDNNFVGSVDNVSVKEVIGDQPRLNYDISNGQVQSCPSLLLEPASTNNIDNSTNFFSGSWGGTRLNQGTSIVSPDGSLDAHKLVATSVSNTHYRQYTVSSAAANSYTSSAFFKKGEYSIGCIRLGVDTNANRYAVFFNLENGSFVETATVGSPTGTSYKIENYGNGWYKLSVTVSHTSGDVISVCTVAPTGYTISSGLPVYLGNSSDGAYSWGAQTEALSYATSYIPTTGASQTRARDLCDTQNLSSLIGQTEGVIFYDAILVYKSTDTSQDLFELSIDDGSNQNFFFLNNYNNTLVVGMKNGGSTQFTNNSFNPTEGARYKLAFAYKQNDFALYINGNQISTDLSGTVPAMNQITFGNYYNNDINLSNSVKVNDFRLFKTRLTNAQLQTLTTL